MSNWTSGYVADIGYTYGYYSELNPLRIKLAFLDNGLVSPDVESACELGFGQGVSVNFHAAGSPVAWHGTDFNPSQAGYAQELAAVAGTSANLRDEAFAEFAQRKDLPDFDFIALHGIWSWISDENRAVIVDFIRRKLKVGGVAYISYNTLPGWAAFAPMRHLMTEHAEIIGAEGRGIVSRVDDAIEFADKLLATNPMFLKANPLIADRIKQMKKHNRHYLAHEYFNRDWHPMHFATMAEWLKDAKVQYACSASFLEHVDVVNLTPEQQAFVKEIPDPMFRESVRDFMTNQQFRRDFWVKGLRRLSALEQVEQVRQQRVMLVTPREDVSLTLKGMVGEVTMTEKIYVPILDSLADNKPKLLGQVEQLVAEKGINLHQLLQAAALLTAAGNLSPVQDEATAARMRKRTDKLNLHLVNKSRHSVDNAYLASPMTGGGIAVDRISQLFLLAIFQGRKQAPEWVQFVWQVLSAQGHKLIKEGKTLDTLEENMAELTALAEKFSKKQLPMLKALQIA